MEYLLEKKIILNFWIYIYIYKEFRKIIFYIYKEFQKIYVNNIFEN
jgi:hypothetical protein